MTSQEKTGKAKRAREIVQRLKKQYPKATTKLIHDDVFQLLIATILSAQSTDAQVNRVLPELFKKFKAPGDFANANLEELRELIHSTGYFNQKAKHIKATARKIQTDYNGKTPSSMKELVKLPGVGRKTANIVLSHGFGRNEGIAVDTHVFRLSKRLELSKARTPEKVEKDLIRIIPKKEWGTVNSLLVLHGRRVCTARNPKHSKCILYDLCPSRNL